VTDDSELAMCLMHAFIDNEDNIKNGKVDMNKVAKRYADWIKSPPFDIGFATDAALGPLVS
jgi:ADP-ribosylglycohydrolase